MAENTTPKEPFTRPRDRADRVFVPYKREEVTFTRPTDRADRIFVPVTDGNLTNEEKRDAIRRGMEEGLYTGGGALVGAVAGGKTGALVGGAAAGPPGAVAGGLLGTVGGMLLGGKASEEAASQIIPEEEDDRAIPYREGGKTTGQSIAAAPGVFFLPQRFTSTMLGRFVSELGTKARKYPISYIMAETGAAAGAGVGAGLAENYDPGDPTTRFAAEVAGGAASPFKLVLGNVGPLTTGIKNTIRSFTPGGREQRAANLLLDVIESKKGDPKALIKELQRIRPAMGAYPSTAQATGNPFFISLEKSLGAGSPSFLAGVDEQGKTAFHAYQEVIDSLREIGDPNTLTAAAEMQKNLYTSMLHTNFTLAEAKAASSINRIKVNGPAQRRQIGKVVYDTQMEAVENARAYERALWEEAYRKSFKVGAKGVVAKKVRPAKLGETFMDFVTSMTPERYQSQVPSEIKSIMTRLGVGDKALARYEAGKKTTEYLKTKKVPQEFLSAPVAPKKGKAGLPSSLTSPVTFAPTVKETEVTDLIKIRGDMLAFSREAAASGNLTLANLYGKMASAALDDLDTLNIPAYDKARSFSRKFNDYYTRSFAGEIGATNKKGAEKIPPELLVTKAFAKAGDVSAKRFEDIESSVGLMVDLYKEAVTAKGPRSKEALALAPFAKLSEDGVATIREAQKAFMLTAANSAVTRNPVTGAEILDANKLAKFVQENKDVLDKVGLTGDLTDALKAENAMRSVLNPNSVEAKRALNEQDFAVLLNGVSPADALNSVLRSRAPVVQLGRLIRTAQKEGPSAMDGLKSSIYSLAYEKAGGDKKFSPTKFKDFFYKGLTPDGPSLARILSSNKVMSLSEYKNLSRLLSPMEKIEAATKGRASVPVDEELSDQFSGFIARLMGAKAASLYAPKGPGSLVIAGQSAKYAEDLFAKMPSMQIKTILQEAASDPQLMLRLLEKGKSAREKALFLRQFGGYLYSAGYTAMSPQIPDVLPEEAEEQLREMQGPQRRTLPPGVKTRGTLSPGQGAGPQPPAGGPPPGGPPNTQSRMMLQSLFPNDATLQMPPPQPPMPA